MTGKTRSIAPLLAAGAVAVGIAAAPDASAAAARTCGNRGGATICESPGNVEVHTDRPEPHASRIYGAFSTPIPFLFNEGP
jgi:hypothetical protein